MKEINVKEKLLKILSGYMDSHKVMENEELPLPVDSVVLLEIITIIEGELNIVISDEEVEHIKTFKNMMDVINNKLD